MPPKKAAKKSGDGEEDAGEDPYVLLQNYQKYSRYSVFFVYSSEIILSSGLSVSQFILPSLTHSITRSYILSNKLLLMNRLDLLAQAAVEH